jgi:hypothetical protein
LAVLGELLHQIANRPGGLAIQARCRFIKEQKEFRACRELNPDGQTFPLFHIETLAQGTNNRVGAVFKVDELDDFLDVIELLLPGIASRLS